MPTASASMRLLSRLLVLAMMLSMAGMALADKQRSVLAKKQYAYSAAIRWGDFEGAWSLVDPKVREEKPMTDADFSRYEQIQVTSYRDLAAQPGPEPDTERREIQIQIVNRNTLRQTSVRYTEVWRYDAKAKTWWVSGLPNFWDGR